MMGAPSVAIEKFPKGDEFVRVFEKLGKYLDQETIAGTFPMEAGGVNSMIPIVVAAEARHSLGGLRWYGSGLSRIAYGNVPFEWDVSDPYGNYR